MPIYGSEIVRIQPPVDWQLEGTSAWINMITSADRPEVQQPRPEIRGSP